MRTQYLYLLFALALTSAGCQRGGETDAVPTPPTYNGQIQVDANGAALIECLPFNAKMGNLQGSVKAFKFNGSYSSDKVDVRLSSSIDLHNKELVFYRWRQQSNGQVITDTNPLNFDVTLNTGQIYTGYTVITAESSGALNTSQVSFTVHGTDIGYSAIQVAIYNKDTGQIEMYSDALIPFVYAQPRQYRETHENQNQLTALHPYSGVSNQNEDDEVFARRSYSDFCF